MIVIALTALLAAATPSVEPTDEPALQCNVGPAIKRIGGNDWIVYGCADGRSVVIVAGEPNPATPFVFILTPAGDEIELHGEGTGAKSATEPAYEELKDLSAVDLATLFQAAREAGKP